MCGGLCRITGKEIYHYKNHPIKWVRLTGVVIAIDDFNGRRVYSLDDSSGVCIECSCALPVTPDPLPSHSIVPVRSIEPVNGNRRDAQKSEPPPDPNLPLESIDIGTVVKVKGGISMFWGQKRIEIKRVQILGSTDEEVRCWDEVGVFLRDVVGRAWILSEEEQRKCRRRWEREQRKALKEKNAEKGVKRMVEMEKMKGQESAKRSTALDSAASRVVRRLVEMERAEQEEKQKEKEKEREREREERMKRRHAYTEKEIERRNEKKHSSKSSKEKLKEKEKERTGNTNASKINIPTVAMSRIAGKYDALGL
ncbi:hypothetical protein B7463_g4680, partial [Scytalidium lignicola]